MVGNSSWRVFCLICLFWVSGAGLAQTQQFLGLDSDDPFGGILAPDSASLINVSNDTGPPRWSDIRQSTSEPLEKQTVLLYAKLEDDLSLSHAILSTNETGEFVNWTDRYGSPLSYSLGENETWAVFHWRNSSAQPNTTVGWKVWFNDTVDRWNATPVTSFKVQPTPVSSGRKFNSTAVVCPAPEANCTFTGNRAIQDAIETVATGTTLDVKPGNYSAVTVLVPNLTIRGRDLANTTIDGGGGPFAVQVLDFLGNLTKFENFTLRNADFGVIAGGNASRFVAARVLDLTGPMRGVEVVNARDYALERVNLSGRSTVSCRVNFGVTTCGYNFEGQGITVDPSENVSIENVVIENATRGIDIIDGKKIRVSNSRVKNPMDIGSLTSTQGLIIASSENVVIENSSIVNVGVGLNTVGISVSNSKQLAILNSSLESAYSNTVVFHSLKNLTISYNLIKTGVYTIRGDDAETVLIHKNDFVQERHACHPCIAVGGPNVNITDNTFTGTSVRPISAIQGSGFNWTVRNNKILNAGGGIGVLLALTNSTLSDNTISVVGPFGQGIQAVLSNSTLRRNSITTSEDAFIGFFYRGGASQEEFFFGGETNDIDASNMINGKPIFYVNGNNLSLENKVVGGLIVASSNNTKIRDVTISDDPIILNHAHFVTIENSTIGPARPLAWDIRCVRSSNITVFHNNFLTNPFESGRLTARVSCPTPPSARIGLTLNNSVGEGNFYIETTASTGRPDLVDTNEDGIYDSGDGYPYTGTGFPDFGPYVDPFGWLCQTPFNNMRITNNTTLCPGNYTIADPENNGAVIIDTPGVRLNCNGARLIGSGSGRGLAVSSADGAVVRGCRVENYKDGIVVFSPGVRIRDSAFNGNQNDGLLVLGSTNVTLLNVTANSNLVGIDIASASNASIRSCIACGNPGGDLAVFSSPGSKVLNTTCDFSDPAGLCFCPCGSTDCAQHEVGPAGGVVSIPSGNATLSIPSSALNATAVISIRGFDPLAGDGFIVRRGEFENASLVFDFTSTILPFNKNVTVTLKYDPAVVGNNTDLFDIYRFNATTNTWDPTNASADTVSRTYSVNVTNFSFYFVARRLAPTATIDADPDSINLKSRGRFITAYIEIPGSDVRKIDPASVRFNDIVPLDPFWLRLFPQFGDHDLDGVPDLMVKFDRQEVQAILSPGENVTISVSGTVDGQPFTGTDTIRVFHNDTEENLFHERQQRAKGPPAQAQGGGRSGGGGGGGPPTVPPGLENQGGAPPGQQDGSGSSQGVGQGGTPPGQGGTPPGQSGTQSRPG